ncbi:glutathione S-transferase family protein [Simiduia agarivorans]|uniref:Glutathione S-transferase domain-containing protein n=1 Tax=Simiduia agarivorans (strain DSM 21679 / JCM 13881 / BCRC 17597 / SA1) TaxID=1117647 RepID=K4KRF8_SIMAS|nr:glutathione S-transferase family protein [Simiduia agarivorans]AFV00876.1 glutathione S-transferase domain-containing protein [Simiduia agarivorans SA1 = DSM 21679]
MKLYGDSRSGNCYKVQLTLALLQREHEFVAVDILQGGTKTAEFLALNPNGKIPTLVLDDGRSLWESNAIINYLSAGSPLLPADSFQMAKVQQWQFFEQYSHEPYIAVARFINKYLGLPDDRRAEYEAKQQGGYKALAVMEQQLAQTPFLVGDSLTTADIALFGYTPVAHEGGFDLSGFPHINAWMQRVRTQPGFIAMESLAGC